MYIHTYVHRHIHNYRQPPAVVLREAESSLYRFYAPVYFANM